jgi:TonB-dependent receptor
MKMKFKLLASGGMVALFAAILSPAFAQTNPTAATPASATTPADQAGTVEVVKMPTFYVTGLRASMETAQEIKQNSPQIVDSIVATDINKLPDTNVAEALQRISGIQIPIELGEGGTSPQTTGGNIAIRGLTQVETFVNGREVLTGAGTRTVSFEDFAAALVAGLDVYKTSTANVTEGGTGGTIDIRFRKPFDFKGLEVDAMYRIVNGSLVRESKPQYNLLVSDRWKAGGGEMGVLVNVSYQLRPLREDQAMIGNPTPYDILSTGAIVAHSSANTGSQTISVPNGDYQVSIIGFRRREGVNAVLQWKPNPRLEFDLEGNYHEFLTHQDQYGFSQVLGQLTSVTLWPGTNDVETLNSINAGFTTISAARDTVDRDKLAAFSVKWTGDNFILKGDFSYTKTYSLLYYAGPILSGTSPNLFMDTGPHIPTTVVTGVSLLDPSLYSWSTDAWRTRPFYGKMSAEQLDGEYKLSNNVIPSIFAGIRYAAREADDGTGTLFNDATISGPVTTHLNMVTPNPVPDFFPYDLNPMFRQYLVGSLAQARDPLSMRSSFGITTTPATSAGLVSLWVIHEDTSALYLMPKFTANLGLPVDGNVGVRLVRTKESVTGYQSNAGVISPIAIDTTYTDWLPSANVRVHLTDNTFLRLAASKTLTRPDFSQLSPSITLTPNPTNAAQNSGSAGNPALPPVRADNYDLSLEKYFNKSTSVYVAGFYKTVNGFTTTISNPEVWNGVTYQVSRPAATNGAKIKGFEVGYQQFYDFLPGFLSGLGMQLNYTYVDSKTPSTIVGLSTPLQSLSRKSYNAILMYEKYGVSARIAYNWRDKYLASIGNFVGIGALPNFYKAYGWLDASVSYDFTKRLRVTIEGANLLNTVRESYWGVGTRPGTFFLDDVQFMAYVSWRL